MTGTLQRLLNPFLGERISRSIFSDSNITGNEAAGETQLQKDVEEPTAPVGGLSFAFRFMSRDRAALISMGIIALFLVWAVVEGMMQWLASFTRHPAYAWLLLPSNPTAYNPLYQLAPPNIHSLNLILGATYDGQSILSSILYAAPHDAEAAFVVVASAIIIGMLVGMPAGYFGGWTDEILMRLTDAFLAFPYLILAITLSLLIGSGFSTVLVVLVIIWWPTYARYFRAQAIALKSRTFVEAAKLSRVGSWKIMFRHLLPNSVDPIIAQATLDLGTVILTYSALAFIGVGLQVNEPEWGAMASLGLGYLQTNPLWSLAPGFVILIIVVAFSLIGDRLQDLIAGRMMY